LTLSSGILMDVKPMMMILAMAPLGVVAQDARPPIGTDRPGFSDGSNLVAPKVFQIETGFFRTEVQKQATTSVGDVLFRYGLSQQFELRIINVSYGFAPGDVKGWLDPSIGFKLRLSQRNGEWTLIGQTTVPTGTHALRVNEWNPTAKIAWTKPIKSDTIGGNFVLARMGSSGSQFTQGAVSLFYSRPISPKDTLTGEIWFVDRIGKGLPGAGFTSLAIANLVNNDTQLDVRIGTGFNQNRDGWFLQGGLSIRF